MDVQKKFELPFEERYSYQYAKHYNDRHKRGGLRNFSNTLEQRMAAQAYHLAGSPEHVLDLPCGAGRFWETLFGAGAKHITGIDKSEGMIQVCREETPQIMLNNITLLQGDAQHIPLEDKSVDSIFCMRLIHHIDILEYRQEIYREFQRVARDTVCISYWVDNNIKSAINLKRPHKNQNYLNRKALANELRAAGFKILGHSDMLRWYSPWRTYVLGVK